VGNALEMWRKKVKEIHVCKNENVMKLKGSE
jgi:hypothetical protein